MLGTEYNWLITTSDPADGIPRVRLASTGPLTLAVAVFCLVCVTLRAEPPHRELMRAATAAAQAGDTTTLIAKLEAARALRPDYPRILSNLARAYAQAGRSDEAIAQLQNLAAMGLRFELARVEAFAPLRNRPDFAALAERLSAPTPASALEVTASTIRDMDGIVEGLALRPTTLESFFSDVRNRCIWYRDANDNDGAVKKFSTDADGLLGVFALKIEESNARLWASCSTVPEMTGFTAGDRGRAFLACYDLDSRKFLGTFPIGADGRDHVLGDFVIAPDGTIYATDSTAPIIWRLHPGGRALEKWIENDDFVSLQGVAFGPNGTDLYASDYGNGLWRIDPVTRRASLLPAPAHTTLFGVDGIYSVSGGFIGVQNGTNPQRIIRIDLAADGSAAGVNALLNGDAATADFALGQVINGHFNFVATSGWSQVEASAAAHPNRHLSILRIPLDQPSQP